MIKLFASTDKVFNTSNGDKIIKPRKAAVRCEDNGEFYLDLEADLLYSDDLIEGAVLVAPTPQGEQAFRVNNVQKTNTKIITRAKHVFYDSDNYLIVDSYVVNKNCNDALAYLNAATSDTSPFTTYSDVATIASFRCVRKSLNEAVETILERWGGHLVRDNFNIKILQNVGVDNGVTIRYKKNLREITSSANWDDVVTRLLPVGKDGTLLNALDPSASLYVTSSISYDRPYTKKVSFEQDIEREDYQTDEAYLAALIVDLRAQAQNYVNDNCIPKINYTLSAHVDKITGIGDTIDVIDERLNLNLTAKVIAYEYNCLTKQFTQIEFGNFEQKLSDLLADINASTEQKLSDYATSAQLDATNAQVAQKLNSSDLAISITQLPTAVQLAWNGISNYIQFEQGALDIYDSNVTSTQKLVAKYDHNGAGYYRDGYYLGYLGTTSWINNTSKKGLAINLEPNGQFISFGQKASSGDTQYTSWLTLNRSGVMYTNSGINLGTDLYCNNWKIHDFFIDNLQVTYNSSNYYGYTGSIPFIMSITDNGDGTISWQYSHLRVANGIIVGYWN